MFGCNQVKKKFHICFLIEKYKNLKALKMSPEDDHLQGDQISTNNDRDNWSATKPFNLKENSTSIKNGGITAIPNNGYINSNTILKQNGGDSHTWLPLLNHHHTNDIDQTALPTNNNKWPVLTSPVNLSQSKYVWRELPQDDDSLVLFKPNLNTPNANGSGLNSMHNGGNLEKNEHESLTGIVRHTMNDDCSNDSYGDRSNCGIGLCKPKWARMFASTHVFMVIFLLAWILQVPIKVSYLKYF